MNSSSEKDKEKNGFLDKLKDNLWRISVIFWIILAFILTFVIFFSVDLKETFQTFLNAAVPIVITYLVVSATIELMLTYKWNIVLKSMGYDVGFFYLFIYRLIGFSVSYLTPISHVGGEGVRAAMLRDHDVPASKGLSSVLTDRSLEFLLNSVFFFMGGLIILNMQSFPWVERTVLFVISVSFSLAFFSLLYNILKGRQVFLYLFRLLGLSKIGFLKKFEETLIRIEEDIARFYSEKKKAFFNSMVAMAILWMLMYFEYHSALLIMGEAVSVTSIFLFLTGVGIAYMMPVPAALGVLELSQISATAILGVSSAVGVALSFLIRARDLLITVLGMTLLSVFRKDFFFGGKKKWATSEKD